MPAPAIAAAAIAGGAQLLGTGAQMYAQGKMNKKTRQWNEKMYGIQRQHALEDWDMMNKYNSPEQQMQRYKEAGLNPNLIYGQTNEASPVRSTDMQGWKPQVPDMSGIGKAGEAFAEISMRQRLMDEQIENMRQQRENMEVDNLIKTIVATGKETDNKAKEFDLGLKQELKDTNIDHAKQVLENIRTQNAVLRNRDEREAAVNSSTIAEAAARIIKIRAEASLIPQQRAMMAKQMESIQKDVDLKNLDIRLKEKGINPSDPAWLRILGQILSAPGEYYKKLDDALRFDLPGTNRIYKSNPQRQ